MILRIRSRIQRGLSFFFVFFEIVLINLIPLCHRTALRVSLAVTRLTVTVGSKIPPGDVSGSL